MCGIRGAFSAREGLPTPSFPAKILESKSSFTRQISARRCGRERKALFALCAPRLVSVVLPTLPNN
jgi:hypothetical protein